MNRALATIDDAFEAIVYGDVLEHLVDPLAVSSIGRISASSPNARCGHLRDANVRVERWTADPATDCSRRTLARESKPGCLRAPLDRGREGRRIRRSAQELSPSPRALAPA
jgi:hypothetical protein